MEKLARKKEAMAAMEAEKQRKKEEKKAEKERKAHAKAQSLADKRAKAKNKKAMAHAAVGGATPSEATMPKEGLAAADGPLPTPTSEEGGMHATVDHPRPALFEPPAKRRRIPDSSEILPVAQTSLD